MSVGSMAGNGGREIEGGRTDPRNRGDNGRASA